MVEIRASYRGDLCCVAEHGPSGSSLTTDAPADNQGLGRYFSPTDLLATSLLTCALTTMGIVARCHGFELELATGRVHKGMVADPHRRVGRLQVEITLPSSLDAGQRALLEEAARGCPVARSLDPGLEVSMAFDYPEV